MKKFLKVLAIVFAVILLILIIIPIAFRGKIDNIVKREAAAALKAEVDFDKLSISLIRHFPKASVGVKNLTVKGVDQFAGDTLLKAGMVSATVDVMSLFGDSGFEITRVIVDKPTVKAIVLADGSANWDIARESEDKAPEEKPEAGEPSTFKLQMQDVRLNDGEIIYIDEQSSMQFYTKGLNIGLKGDMSADQSDLKLKMKTGSIYLVVGKATMISNATAQADIDIAADFAANKYTFDKNMIRLNAIQFGLDGWVAMDGDATDMDIKLNSEKIEFKDILSMIPAFYTNDFKNLTASGQMTLSAWAKGRMEGDKLPQFELALNVADGSFKYASLPKSVDRINISAQVTNPGGPADRSVIDVSNFSLSMAGNPFKATFHAVTPVSDMNFRAVAGGTVNLGVIKEVYPLGDSLDLGGTVALDLSIAGKMSDIEKERYENIRGEGKLEVSDMLFDVKDMPAVAINKMIASVTPSAMSLSEFDLKIGRSDVNAKGQITNYMSYIFSDGMLSGSLTVDSNMLDLNEFMTNSAAEETQTAESAETAEMEAVKVPENLNLTLNASFKEVLFQKMKITNLTGQITVANGELRMNSLSLNALGGAMRASGVYSSALSALSPELSMNVDVANASFSRTFEELEMVQQMAPVFEKTGGNYSMTMQMRMNFDKHMIPELMTVQADGVIKSQDIHIQNLPVFEKLADALKDDRIRDIQAKDIVIPFTIENGFIRTEPFDLKVAGINMNLSGTTGLDSSINYTAKVTMPDNTAGGFITNVNVYIRGTVTDPKIELGVKDVVQDAVKQLINKELGNKLTGGSDKNIDEELAKKADKMREDAKNAGDKLIENAKKQGEKLIQQASNPLTKAAAQKSAEALVKEAEKNAGKLQDEAEKNAQKLSPSQPQE